MKKALCFVAGLFLLIDLYESRRVISSRKLHDDNYSSRLVGGTFIKENEFPYFVRVDSFTEHEYKKIYTSNPQDTSGGIILNTDQVLVPATLTNNTYDIQIIDKIYHPYIVYHTDIDENYSVARICPLSQFRELNVGERVLPPHREFDRFRPMIFDLAVLNTNRDMISSNSAARPAKFGSKAVKPGDRVTIVSVGADHKGVLPERPKKLPAKVVACPEELAKSKTFCVEVYYACGSDKGSLVVKDDGLVYGMVTYSENCDAAIGLIAVRAMDLVQLAPELKEVATECLKC